MEDEAGYTHDDILDAARLGNAPSEEYLQRVEAIDNVVRDCMYVSKSFVGISAPMGKHFYASVLFTSLITRAVSLVNLIPHTPWAKKLIEHWDYSSCAVVVRTMLETRLAFHYLCVDECDK